MAASAVSWKLVLWMAFGRKLLQVLVATLGLMGLLAFVEQSNLSQILSVVLYGWPILMQISTLLWAKEVEDKTWQSTLHLQGFSNFELYKLILLASTICSILYMCFWWAGASSSVALAADLFPERPRCEWNARSCSVPMLVAAGHIDEIIERLLRIGGCLLMPILICRLCWQRRFSDHWIWMFVVGTFLLQEIVFAWLPLNS